MAKKRQSSAWGHRVVKVIDAPEPESYQIEGLSGTYWRNHCDAADGKGAALRECHGPEEYVCMYEYVTGRAGRVTTRIAARCRAHAEVFCRNHSIDMKRVPEIKHADWHKAYQLPQTAWEAQARPNPEKQNPK